MKTFQGRVVAPGQVTAKALVSHGGLNTLASFQNALQFGDKQAKCGDQNNPDLYGKPMVGTALCLPQTIGSTTGGLVLYCAAAMGRQPACMLFSKPIDSLAAAGAILADVDAMSLEDARKAAIDAVKQLSADVGIPADLKEIVKAEDIDFLSQSAFDDACRPGNPRDTSVEEIKELYLKLM